MSDIDNLIRANQTVSRGLIERNDALRMREDGQGIATGKWERFKVAFFDIFRRTETIEKMKLATSGNFIQMLHENGLHSDDVITGKPLTARQFKSVMNEMQPMIDVLTPRVKDVDPDYFNKFSSWRSPKLDRIDPEQGASFGIEQGESVAIQDFNGSQSIGDATGGIEQGESVAIQDFNGTQSIGDATGARESEQVADHGLIDQTNEKSA